MLSDQRSNTRLPALASIFLVAVGYFVLAILSLAFSFKSSNATPVWPPSGFAFAMILLYGNRIAPGIFIGAFAANLFVFEINHTISTPPAIIISIVIGMGNTAESLVGKLLLQKILPPGLLHHYFDKVSHVLKFSLTGSLMCLVSSFIGTTAVFLGNIITDDQYPVAWITWWLGDFSGIMLVTSFLLIWKNYFNKKNERSESDHKTSLLEDTVLFLLVIILSGIIFDDWFLSLFIFKWPFWIIPILVWSAIRFGNHKTITAIAICSATAIWGTIHGHGTYASLPLYQALLVVQSYISIITVTALTLHSSILERNKIELALRVSGDQLDIRVKERTAELEQRNQFIETLFDSVEDLMAVFDTKGNYLSVNKKIEDIYKLTREDIIGKNILELYPQLESSDMYSNLKKAMGGELIHHLSYHSLISNRYFENYYIPLKNNKQEVYGILVIGHDNTPVMEAAAKVEDINKKLNEAQRLAHIGSWQWDVPGNRITWSDELYRIFGLEKDKFESNYENYLRHIHPDDRDLVNQVVQNSYADKQPFDFYHRIIRPDGKLRTLHGRGEVVTNDKNEALVMTGTAQDVTELKLAEQEIKKMAEELLRNNKELEQINKELESFTFVASHDLQEPLRKIRTFLTLIGENEPASLSDTSKDYFRRTIKAAEQMQQLIIDLLAYSRATGSEEHFKKTDLNVILQQVKNELKETIEEKNVRIESDRLPAIEVIPFQFHQLFTNLLTNSIKFSRADIDPVIWVKYELSEGSRVNGMKKDPAAKYHSFSVMDNGIGFDVKYNEKVFGLFQRLNSKHLYSGTGIGLSICKKIVENHKGIITAHGERDKGTTISFEIPAKD